MKKLIGSLACSPRQDEAGSLYAVRAGAGSGVKWEGWRRWFAHPFGGAVCRGHVQYTAFAPNSLKCCCSVT